MAKSTTLPFSPVAWWEPLASVDRTCWGGATVVCDRKIYRIGGKTKEVHPRPFKNSVIDLESGRVEPLPPLNKHRHDAVVGEIAKRIIVAGGCWDLGNRLTRFRSVEIFDTRTGEWSVGPELPLAISAAAGGVIGGELIVAGGFSHGAKSQTRTWVLDLEKGWYYTSIMPQHRAYAASAVWNGRLFVFGGISRFRRRCSCYVYEAKKGKWAVGKAMPFARASAAAACLHDEILITGGIENSIGFGHDQVLVYDPRKNSYAASFPMGQARDGHSLCVSDHTVYAFGGRKRSAAERASQNFCSLGITPNLAQIALGCVLLLVQGIQAERRIAGVTEEVVFPSCRVLTLKPNRIPAGSALRLRNRGKAALIVRSKARTRQIVPGQAVLWTLTPREPVDIRPARAS